MASHAHHSRVLRATSRPRDPAMHPRKAVTVRTGRWCLLTKHHKCEVCKWLPACIAPALGSTSDLPSKQGVTDVLCAFVQGEPRGYPTIHPCNAAYSVADQRTAKR